MLLVFFGDNAFAGVCRNAKNYCELVSDDGSSLQRLAKVSYFSVPFKAQAAEVGSSGSVVSQTGQQRKSEWTSIHDEFSQGQRKAFRLFRTSRVHSLRPQRRASEMESVFPFTPPLPQMGDY